MGPSLLLFILPPRFIPPSRRCRVAAVVWVNLYHGFSPCSLCQVVIVDADKSVQTVELAVGLFQGVTPLLTPCPHPILGGQVGLRAFLAVRLDGLLIFERLRHFRLRFLSPLI